jgi:hypothetical protein
MGPNDARQVIWAQGYVSVFSMTEQQMVQWRSGVKDEDIGNRNGALVGGGGEP